MMPSLCRMFAIASVPEFSGISTENSVSERPIPSISEETVMTATAPSTASEITSVTMISAKISLPWVFFLRLSFLRFSFISRRSASASSSSSPLPSSSSYISSSSSATLSPVSLSGADLLSADVSATDVSAADVSALDLSATSEVFSVSLSSSGVSANSVTLSFFSSIYHLPFFPSVLSVLPCSVLL